MTCTWIVSALQVIVIVIIIIIIIMMVKNSFGENVGSRTASSSRANIVCQIVVICMALIVSAHNLQRK